MRGVSAGPADWVVKAAVQSNSSGSASFSQRGSLQPGGRTRMINDDKHLAQPSGER